MDNGIGKGYEKFNGMEAAVKIQGRTYHFLPNATQGHGLNYFTFENDAGVDQHATMIQGWKTKKEKVNTDIASGMTLLLHDLNCQFIIYAIRIVQRTSETQ